MVEVFVYKAFSNQNSTTTKVTRENEVGRVFLTHIACTPIFTRV